MSTEPNPYAAPQATGESAIPGSGIPVQVPYQSGRTRGNWAAGLLAAGILLNLVFLGVEAWEIGILNRVRAGQEVPEMEITSNQVAVGLVGIVQFLILIPTAVAFLMWFHRAYRNLPALGAASLRFTPAWAVGYFFFPILNLIRPYQIAREIWIASDPDAGATAGGGGLNSSARVSPIVGFWWLLWVFSGIVGWATARMAASEDISMLLGAAWTGVASSLMEILAAILAIFMIRIIEDNQEEKNRRLGGSGSWFPG